MFKFKIGGKTMGTSAAALGLFFAICSGVTADQTKGIEEAVAGIGAAFSRMDYKEIRSYFSDDHLVVSTYTGVMPVDDYMTAAKTRLDLKSASVEQHSLVPLGRDAYLRTYFVENHGTFDGKSLPRRVLATQIWVRENGKWVQRLYQETPLQPE